MKKKVFLLAGVLLVTALVLVLGVCMLDADAPDSGSLPTPEESGSGQAASPDLSGQPVVLLPEDTVLRPQQADAFAAGLFADIGRLAHSYYSGTVLANTSMPNDDPLLTACRSASAVGQAAVTTPTAAQLGAADTVTEQFETYAARSTVAWQSPEEPQQLFVATQWYGDAADADWWVRQHSTHGVWLEKSLELYRLYLTRPDIPPAAAFAAYDGPNAQIWLRRDGVAGAVKPDGIQAYALSLLALQGADWQPADAAVLPFLEEAAAWLTGQDTLQTGGPFAAATHALAADCSLADENGSALSVVLWTDAADPAAARLAVCADTADGTAWYICQCPGYGPWLRSCVALV